MMCDEAREMGASAYMQSGGSDLAVLAPKVLGALPIFALRCVFLLLITLGRSIIEL